MNRYRLLLLGATLSGMSAAASADDFFVPASPAAAGETRAVYGTAKAFFGYDAVPVSQRNKDWSVGFRPRGGTNVEINSVSYEVGVQWQGYRVGYIERSDWMAKSSRDMIDYIYANKSGTALDAGRTYALDYEARGFTADGLRLTKSFSNEIGPGWQLDWGGAFSLLRGTSLQGDDASGTATATGHTLGWVKNYSGSSKWASDLLTSIFPDVPSFFTLPPGTPTGQGYSIDIGIGIAHESGLRFDWVASDAVGRMKWTDIAELQFSGPFNAANKPAGIVDGGQRRVNFTETLPVKHSLSLSIPTRMANLELSDTIYQGINMPVIGLSKRVTPDFATRLDYDVRFSTVGLGVSYQWLYLNLRTDSLNLNKAHAFGASIGARLEF